MADEDVKNAVGRDSSRDADEDRDEREEMEERRREGQPARPAEKAGATGGFFHLYKPGQGYWTRMGTAGGLVLLLVFIAKFLYGALSTMTIGRTAQPENAPIYPPAAVVIGIVVGLVIGCAILLWWILNKPSVVDFLIATETEMKKVNWTSRKDLIGSTKVVIFFMVLIAATLFLYDVVFGLLFQLIGVLKHGPFG